jgi:hypothetical protein
MIIKRENDPVTANVSETLKHIQQNNHDSLFVFNETIQSLLWCNVEMPLISSIQPLPNASKLPEFCATSATLLLAIHDDPEILLDHQFVNKQFYNQYPQYAQTLDKTNRIHAALTAKCTATGTILLPTAIPLNPAYNIDDPVPTLDSIPVNPCVTALKANTKLLRDYRFADKIQTLPTTISPAIIASIRTDLLPFKALVRELVGGMIESHLGQWEDLLPGGKNSERIAELSLLPTTTDRIESGFSMNTHTHTHTHIHTHIHQQDNLKRCRELANWEDVCQYALKVFLYFRFSMHIYIYIYILCVLRINIINIILLLLNIIKC